jgi:Transglycosylase SLT domain
MATYTYGQLESLWLEVAKGTKYATNAWAALMAAIAEAESSGNADAYNPSGASGLWQILGAVHPADQPHLFDPLTNAREALAKLESQGLGAWVTYTSGAYKKFLQPGTNPASLPTSAGGAASTAASSGGGDGLLGIPAAIVGAFTDADKALGGLWTVLTALLSPSTYVRAAAGIAGLLLLGLGLFALGKAVT